MVFAGSVGGNLGVGAVDQYVNTHRVAVKRDVVLSKSHRVI